MAVEDIPDDLHSATVAEAISLKPTSTKAISPAPTVSPLGNATQNDTSDSLWGKWKQMMEDVKAAMADLVAKLHGESDSG